MINEKIDEILAGYLNKEPLTDEGRQRLEEWLHASPQNEKFGKLVFKLESRKKELDKHQAQEVVFAKIRCYINRKRRKRHLLLWSSCAAGIAIVVGLFFVLRWGPVEIEETFDPRYFSGLPLVGPSAELIMPNGERCLLDSENKIVILVDSTGNMRTDAKTLIVESNEVVGID